MSEPEQRLLVETEPDWVRSSRFSNSLQKIKDRYPDEVPDEVLAAVMMIAEDDVEVVYLGIVAKLRHFMGVEAAGI